ncbi:MAG: hypothetical protein H7X95_03485 [Deltaproteobacteria bacterium]|nr:hypothetical protein [Deltaproteobacteria bacterium]
MKINGPGQPPSSGVSDAEATEKIAKQGDSADVREGSPAGKAFAEKLSGTRPADATRASEAARADGARRVGQPEQVGTRGVGDVAADFRAGKLTAQAAIEKVVDRVVAQQVGPGASPAVRDQVRMALQDAVESDPLLIEKLSRLQ